MLVFLSQGVEVGSGFRSLPGVVVLVSMGFKFVEKKRGNALFEFR